MLTDSCLPEAFLAGLVTDFAGAGIVGMALAGSYARGEASPTSDVDLLRFAASMPEVETDRYELTYRAGRLISLSTTTIAAKAAELSRPETAVWAAPGLQQARSLLDRDGSLGALLRAAHAFRWAPLQPAADAYASYELMGLVEEVHKVLGTLLRGDESTALYGTWGLTGGLTRSVIVQRGVLLRTENAYFQQAQEAVGLASPWAAALRVAAGFEPGPPSVSPVIGRAIAALRLYRETAGLLSPVLRPGHRPTVLEALARIQASGHLPGAS
jgi:hypothetical protein